jgi:hypothetical protein
MSKSFYHIGIDFSFYVVGIEKTAQLFLHAWYNSSCRSNISLFSIYTDLTYKPARFSHRPLFNACLLKVFDISLSS